MQKGEIKWYDQNKGYGFIKPDEGERDIFLHSAGIAPDSPRTFGAGDRVEFEVLDTPRGPRAVNVRKTGSK
jgi:CspA family cold shock protein